MQWLFVRWARAWGFFFRVTGRTSALRLFRAGRVNEILGVGYKGCSSLTDLEVVMEPRASIRFLLPNAGDNLVFEGELHAVSAMVSFLNSAKKVALSAPELEAVDPHLYLQQGSKVLVCPLNTPFLASLGGWELTADSITNDLLEGLYQTFHAPSSSFVVKVDENLSLIQEFYR